MDPLRSRARRVRADAHDDAKANGDVHVVAAGQALEQALERADGHVPPRAPHHRRARRSDSAQCQHSWQSVEQHFLKSSSTLGHFWGMTN
jgi:hypothetical protein